MNVGISSSLSSAGGSGAARRAGAPPSAVLAYPGGGTGVGRAARSRKGSTPGAARTGVSAAGRSNPVAMTVTRISPCIAGSFTVPKMISASSPAASFTTSETCVTSPSVKSSPPVMLISTPVAPVMEMLSSSGEEIACCTASIARFSPRPVPVPMIEAPPFCITVRTSAKSTFTMPVTVMREEMPCVACSSTSSARLRASWNGMPFPTTASSRSFGTTTIVSTCLRISAMPMSAWRIRLRPSNRNGLVTIPIVRAPRSRAICAMMGDAPVPVPPPMPQVTNTMSAPCSERNTSSRFSSIAWRPPRCPAARGARRQLARRVQHQPHRPRVARRLPAAHQPGDPLLGAPRPDGHGEGIPRQSPHPRQMRRPARQHPPRRQPPAPIPSALELALHQLEDLVHALVDDVRQQLARRLPRPLARRGRQVDHLRRVHQRLVRDAVPLLQPLRVRLRHAQTLHQVVGHVRAGELDRREMADLPFVKDRHARRAPAHLHQRDAQLLFVVRQHRVRGGERLEHEIDRPVARALHALAQVLRGRGLDRDEIHLHFEPRPRHPHGVRDPALLIDHVLLRDVVQQLLIPAQRDGAGHLVHARHDIDRKSTRLNSSH